MLAPAPPRPLLPQPPLPPVVPSLSSAPPAEAAEPRFSYGTSFWCAYAANSLLTTAYALLFRYADFIKLLNGNEWHLGWIVGVGMVGSLAMRLTMGTCIDRYGSRIIWLGSLALFAGACGAHSLVASCTGVPIYALRILLCCGVAGVFGASMTFISQQVPVKRMAEAYGMLGTATFVGYFIGAQAGDWLAGATTTTRAAADRMFWVAAIVALAAIPFAWLATRRETPPPPFRGPSSWQLLRKYQPGVLLLAVMATGMVFQMPNAFLRAFTASLHIPRIAPFFMVCAAAALLIRLPTRRWPERFGNPAIVLLGMTIMALSQLTFLGVHSEWQLILPAIVLGGSQAIVGPAMSAAGSVTFPARNRGLAITLIQAAGDVGVLVGSPLAGVIVKYSAPLGLPGYPTLFVAMSALLATMGIWYAIALRRAAAQTLPCD